MDTIIKKYIVTANTIKSKFLNINFGIICVVYINVTEMIYQNMFTHIGHRYQTAMEEQENYIVIVYIII